jgi:hypothetical protein
MGATPGRICRIMLALPLLLALSFLLGCGGSSPRSGNAAEAHLIALATATCRQAHRSSSGGASVLAERKADLVKLRPLIDVDRKLPSVAKFDSDLAAERQFTSTVAKSAGKHPGELIGPNSYFAKAYNLELKVYADARSLGLSSCLGAPPRAAIGG